MLLGDNCVSRPARRLSLVSESHTASDSRLSRARPACALSLCELDEGEHIRRHLKNNDAERAECRRENP